MVLCLLQALPFQQGDCCLSQKLSCQAKPASVAQMERSYADTGIGEAVSGGYDQDMSRSPRNRRAGNTVGKLLLSQSGRSLGSLHTSGIKEVQSGVFGLDPALNVSSDCYLQVTWQCALPEAAGSQSCLPAGVILHPTSLPGPYGIGEIGKEAFRFVDWLESAGAQVQHPSDCLSLHVQTAQ